MKNTSWAIIVILILAFTCYREQIHSDNEVSLRAEADIWKGLAKDTRFKYQRLKIYASIDSIKQAEGEASAAVEQGNRMALQPQGLDKK